MSYQEWVEKLRWEGEETEIGVVVDQLLEEILNGARYCLEMEKSYAIVIVKMTHLKTGLMMIANICAF